MERIKVLICGLGFLCVFSVCAAAGGRVGETAVNVSGKRIMVVIKAVHFLTVNRQDVLWRWRGTPVLIGRRVNHGSLCAAAADVRAVERV